MNVYTTTSLLMVLSGPAFGMIDPPPGPHDACMRIADYDEDNVVRIVTAPDREFDIVFDRTERLQTWNFDSDKPPISAPDPQKAHAASILNLWATTEGETHLIVTTKLPDDSERPYQFLIQVKKAISSSDLTCGLRMTYNGVTKQVQVADAKAKTAETWQAKKAAADEAKAKARLAIDFWMGSHNYNYSWIGDQSILPSEPSDNYQETFLRYPGNREVPAIYTVDTGPWCSNDPPPRSWLEAPEKAVRYDAKDDGLMIHQTAPHYRLRLGQRVADISDCAYDPVGINPGTGTRSPDVVRQVLTKR